MLDAGLVNLLSFCFSPVGSGNCFESIMAGGCWLQNSPAVLCKELEEVALQSRVEQSRWLLGTTSVNGHHKVSFSSWLSALMVQVVSFAELGYIQRFTESAEGSVLPPSNRQEVDSGRGYEGSAKTAN